MNKCAVLTLIFISFSSLLLVVIRSAEADSRTITVPDDYTSIQEALDNALDGDTIYVKKGVYVENPVVNKSISLVGEDRDATVIDVTAGLKVERDNVTITGFTIYDGWHAISLSANNCNISGNKITTSTNGIVLFGCENNSITGNIFVSIGLSSAIQLNSANRNLVNNNYVDSCVEGIQIWQNSNNNTVSQNAIVNCQDTAINFQYSNDNTIIGNNISRSGLGTSIYGSNRNIISNNNYAYNVVQFGASETYYLTFGYNRSVNTIYGNYWSDYNGTDANGDGVGDTPYIIDDNNKDNYPLILPINFTNTFSPTPNLSPTPTLSPTSFPSPSPSSASSPSQSPTSSPTQSPTPSASPSDNPTSNPNSSQNQPLPQEVIYGTVIVALVIIVAAAFALRKRRQRSIIATFGSHFWPFEAALDIVRECGVEAKSVRLDQYYAGQSTAAVFGVDTALYVIPKSNATIQGSYVWKDMIVDLISYPFLFLKEYFRREHSESGFSADKRCDGWRIWQKRDDRIGTATLLKGLWHNLLWLGGNT